MRALLLLAILFAPTFVRADMFVIKIVSMSAKPEGGEASTDGITPANGTYGCNLEKVRPGKKKFTVWVDGIIKEGGAKLDVAHQESGGAPEPVVDCARLVVANSLFNRPAGKYRVSVVATFSPVK